MTTTDLLEQLRLEEYRSLRATVRERGTLRLLVAALTFSTWAVTLLATTALFVVPVFSLIPLAVLAAGFEVGLAIHIGTERIGRYIQTHHEPASSGQAVWEDAIMRFGAPSAGVHPLFPNVFLGAIILNLVIGVASMQGLDSAFSPRETPIYWVVLLAHLAVAVRLVLATRQAALQRARDLAEFERVLGRDRI
jgi:hypothetical protein